MKKEGGEDRFHVKFRGSISGKSSEPFFAFFIWMKEERLYVYF